MASDLTSCGTLVLALWEPFPPKAVPRFLVAVVPSSQQQDTYDLVIEKLKAKIASETNFNWVRQNGRSVVRIDEHLTIAEQDGILLVTTLQDDLGRLFKIIGHPGFRFPGNDTCCRHRRDRRPCQHRTSRRLPWACVYLRWPDRYRVRSPINFRVIRDSGMNR